MSVQMSYETKLDVNHERDLACTGQIHDLLHVQDSRKHKYKCTQRPVHGSLVQLYNE